MSATEELEGTIMKELGKGKAVESPEDAEMNDDDEWYSEEDVSDDEGK